jgi:uncharacterized protein (TIGR02284 family)
MDNAMAENTVHIIDRLIETCRDGQEGYRNAADHIKNPTLKDFFLRQSLQRATFAGELENEAQRLGESDPNRGSTVSGKLHRAWFDLRQKLGGGDLSVLESIEAGEDRARQSYTDALEAGLPLDVHAIVDRQAQSIVAAHDQIRILRDQYKRAA